MQNAYRRELQLKQILLEAVSENLQSPDIEEVKLYLERISDAIKELELEKDKAMNSMLEVEDQTIDEIRQWSQQQKEEIKTFKEVRTQLKDQLNRLQKGEQEHQLHEELSKQRQMMEEAARLTRQQQQKQEEAREKQMQIEEDWMRRKQQIEQETAESQHFGTAQKQPTIKLHKYTITPFEGDFKDWLRFWNQFTVEVDGSGIAQISKFNYLMELVQGKPRDDILGLPHTPEGYEEAKKIYRPTTEKISRSEKRLFRNLKD